MSFNESLDLARLRRKSPGRGRLSSLTETGGRGRFIRPAVPAPGERVTDPAVLATIQAAALRRAEENAPRPLVLPRDLRKKVRVSKSSSLTLFCVDASDSMGASAQLAAAKGAVLALLEAAYIRRDKVGLVVFRGEAAQTLLPPTGSIQLARKKLARLYSGGATPFADGLLKSWNLIRAEKLKSASRQAVLVIVSDGEANVPLVPGADKLAEIRRLGRLIQAEKARTVFVDTNPEGVRKPEAKQFAEALGADYRRLARPAARELVEIAG